MMFASNLCYSNCNYDKIDMECCCYYADSLSPQMESFTVNMTSGQILLTFDEPLDPSSLDVTGIRIQGSTMLTDSSLFYSLTDSSQIFVENDTIIRVNLSDVDMDALQLRPRVATSESNTYISIDPRTVTDRAVPPNRALPILNARVTDFFPDTVSPRIIAFSLNLDANLMTLTFSEPVLHNTFVPSFLTISSTQSVSPGVISYNLTDGSIQSTQTTAPRSVSLSLAQADIIYLKTTPGIATRSNNTYLSALAELVVDTNFNPSLSLFPIPASSVVPDTSAPQVVQFDLDVDQGLLTVYFNDVITVTTFNETAITLQNAPTRVPMESYTITNNSDVLSTGVGFTVTVELSITDLNEIKKIPHLSLSPSRCFMTATASVAADVYGRSAAPVVDGRGLMVDSFFIDITRPRLVSWEMNMDEGRIYMTFDEPVDFLAFSPVEVTLQSGTSVLDSHYQALSLTGYEALFPIGINIDTVLVIQLNQDDIDFIKATINLGTSESNSYLSMTESTITDVNNNFVEPVSVLQVAGFTPDTTSPSLLWFSFNAYTGVLSLMFDEIVNATTFDALGLTLVNRESLPSQAFRLTGGMVTSTNGTIIHLSMGDNDLSSIRALGLGNSFNTTYLTAASSTIRDANDNPLNPVSVESPQHVLYYTNSPIHISFEFPTYIFNEGQPAILRVILNTTATPDVSFTLSTQDSQAIGMCHNK